MSTASHSSAEAPEAAVRRPKVGLVLGSGGIKCAAAVGLWKVLQREGVGVDVSVGCSGGSIYAAALALGQDVYHAEERTHHMWDRLFNRFRYRSLLSAALPRIFGYSERTGLLNDKRIWKVMTALYEDSTFDDTKVPLFIGATDFLTGEKVTITEGLVADAVRASISMPVVLPPWPIDGRLLVDGGASNPLPVDLAIREGCEVIIAMGFENTMHSELRSIGGAIAQSTAVTMNHLLRSTYAFYSAVHHAEIIPVIPDFGRYIKVTDTHLIPYIIEQGERAAEAELPYLRSLLAA